MGTKKSRELKFNFINQAIEAFFKRKPEGKISKKKLLAEFAIANNSTSRTGQELIDMLVETGKIKVNGDDITK